MIVETTLAIILLIALTIMLKRLRSYCDVSNILYEVMVRLNRSFLIEEFITQILYIMTAAEIEPIKIKEYSVKQSKYQVVCKLPIISIILGLSGSGKTVLLRKMI